MEVKLLPHYSGYLSEHFWHLINGLPDHDQQSLYFAGCLLQEMEARVLEQLEMALNLAMGKKEVQLERFEG